MTLDRVKDSHGREAELKLLATISQVMHLLSTHVMFPLNFTGDRKGFSGNVLGEGKYTEILSINARLSDNDRLVVEMGLIRIDDHTAVLLKALLKELTLMGDKVLASVKENDLVAVEMRIGMEALGPARMALINTTIEQIKLFSRFIRESVGNPSPDLAKQYEQVKSFLYPVLPLDKDPGETIGRLAREIADMLDAGISVAICCDTILFTEFVLAAIARELKDRRISTMGKYKDAMLPIKNLLEVLTKAPGYVCVQSIALSFGSNPYDRAEEIDALMSLLTMERRALIFSGSESEHSAVLGSGQGKQPDPLRPVIVRIKEEEIGWDAILSFALHNELKYHGPVEQPRLTEIENILEDITRHNRLRYADAGQVVPLISALLRDEETDPAKFLGLLRSQKESFRGIKTMNKQRRNPDLQRLLYDALIRGDIKKYIRSRLVGQDKAIELTIERLQRMIRFSSTGRPLQLLFQGIPGVGKSELSKCLGDYLQIPIVSISAASSTSLHEAKSMLLGSGRGYVQSYLPGKLEVVAKTRPGCVLEVADLDHAPPEVRGFYADTFLDIIQEGVIHTAIGEVVSAVNLLIIFTINLPGGMDSQVLRGLGFNSELQYGEILSRTEKEIKKMFSGAFARRIGTPILFRPFTIAEKEGIIEMAIKNKLLTCVENLGLVSREVSITPGTGNKLLGELSMVDNTLGASRIYDTVEELVDQALPVDFEAIYNASISKPIKVSIDSRNELNINL
jgi:hypothetical protein